MGPPTNNRGVTSFREKIMATLFTTVLSGMEDNNYVNKAQFCDWDAADHAISVYGENYKGDPCDDAELEAIIDALNRIIRTNGAEHHEAVSAWNIAVWGIDFAHNGESTPYSG